MDKLVNCIECGKELNRRQKMFCSNNCKLKNKDSIAQRTKPKEKLDPNKIAVCIYTGKKYKDYKNYSGALTTHIKKNNIINTNISEIFNIIEIEPVNKYNCRYCNWDTADTSNKSGCITNHIKTHNILIEDHIDKYPIETYLFKHTTKVHARNKFFSENPKSYIVCMECNQKMKKITNKHLKKHNMTPFEYRNKYQKEILSSEDTIEKYKILYESIKHKINVTSNVSKGELEILEFIRTIDPDVKNSVKTLISPYQLDIYSEKYRIAIEYNGLAYHSETFGKKDKNYHLTKTILCEEKNIKLIHIFEDEWHFRKEIVKTKIESIFGKKTDRIGARKCVIKPVIPEEKNNFLNKNHIQGEDRSLHNIGLYYSKELVAIMTFCRPRIFMGHKKYELGEYELSRYATSKSIIGGASKLLNYFIKKHNPKKIISYADRRWSSNINNTMYDMLGFKKVRINKPNYWYLKHYKIRSHRYGFTKQRIINELGGDPNKTEIQNMLELGYDRIWDCGTIKYELIIPW